MSQDRSRDSTNPYVAALQKYLEKPRPIKTRQPPPRVGRPKALGKVRHVGQFLKAIATINSGNKKLNTDSAIAGKLIELPEYQHLSEDRLRHNVAEAIYWLIAVFKECPPDLWEARFGIEPPSSMTRRELRAKALEFLRRELLPNKRELLPN
jgi:hypothetical protein